MTAGEHTRPENFAGISALQSRAPGYSVAAKCLEVQVEAELLDPALRTEARTQLADKAWSWYMGAIGEMHVGELLRKLGPQWFIRHSVPIGTGTTDVDHLLIGPPGVFALNTKHHWNKSVWVGDHVLRVSNINQPHLRNSQHEAAEVKRRLEKTSGIAVTVTPVIVLVGASSLTDRRAVANRVTSVVPESQLLRWLTSQKRGLDEGAMGLILLAAEEPSTWHVDPRAADTLRVMQRFERLRAAVGSSVPHEMPQLREVSIPAGSYVPSRPSRVRPVPRSSTAASSKKAKRRTDELLKGITLLLLAGAAYVFREPLGEAWTWFFMTVLAGSQ